MYHMKCPPIGPLLEVVGRLERAGVPCALGGSGLLAALGLIDTVNDWDLTCDADPTRVQSLLVGHPGESHGNDTLHADHKLALPDDRIEVICGFAFHGPRGVIRLECMPADRWQGVPLSTPETWAVAYTLLADGEQSARRRERAELLFEQIARRGAHAGVIARLLAQPLPQLLAERLRALPLTSTSSVT